MKGLKFEAGKFKLVNIVLWSAYILALIASINHLAWAFGRLEFDPRFGWVPAVGVDCGLAALAYAIQQRKRARRQVLIFWVGIIAFSVISAFANLLHAVAVVTTAPLITWQTVTGVDGLTLAKAIILSASLPLLVVYLGEIVSSDDAEAAKVAEREVKRQERLTEGEPKGQAPLPVVRPQNEQQAAKMANLAKLSDILQQGGNPSQSELSTQLGVSRGTIRNYLAELATNGNGPVTSP